MWAKPAVCKSIHLGRLLLDLGKVPGFPLVAIEGRLAQGDNPKICVTDDKALLLEGGT